MIQLSGLWLNKSKSGEQYFSGNLGQGKIVIFKNKNKKGEKHPDYNMYLVENGNKKEANAKTDDKSDSMPF